MGYYTYYAGSFEIAPPLTKPEYQRLSQVVAFWNSDTIHKTATTDVFSAEWAALTDDDKALMASNVEPTDCTFNLEPDKITDIEEQVKGYQNEEGLRIAALWLDRNGHQLTGEVEWSGESNEDTGTIYAAVVDGHNCIEFVQDQHTNPGPSWGKQPVKA